MLPPWEIAACNVTFGLPEAPFDYALGDTFPHEANYDLLGGVSFTKGCFIGQEVVSRMQNKTVVRKRVVRVHSQVPLISGSDITAGDAVIGKVGTVYRKNALAMVRLDRAAEAQDKGQVLRAGLHALEVDAAALAAYRQSAANRPVIDL